MSPIESSSDPRWPAALEGLLAVATGAVVVWDFDGVIADTEPVHAESYRVLLERRGLVPGDGFFEPMVGHPEPEIWTMLAQAGLATDDSLSELISERRRVVLELSRQRLRPSWVATETIPALASVARDQRVVSAGDPATITELLALWELDRWLAFEPGAGSKRERLEALWATGPSVTVEDSPTYLCLAKAAGSYCVAVRHALVMSQFPEADIELGI